MDKRFVVLPLSAVTGLQHATFDEAELVAGKKVDVDGRPHVIVEVVGEVRHRQVPNVTVRRFGDKAVANG